MEAGPRVKEPHFEPRPLGPGWACDLLPRVKENALIDRYNLDFGAQNGVFEPGLG